MPVSTPPLDYRLDREGTSGINTGPELAILDWSDAKAQPGTVGRVCVRGEPVFPGYLLPDGSFDKSSFNHDGWFDTGDLGFMDADGYLYLTGRNKEVINRGGELISPFEVENAIMSAAMDDTPIRGRVVEVLAFSVSHHVIQEVVAVALVTPAHVPRVDLKSLHVALRSSLQQVKWPVLIVYMDNLPKRNIKVLRINLGQRLGLPEIGDETPYLQRHWEASGPADSDVSTPLSSRPCQIDRDMVSEALQSGTPPHLSYCRTQFNDQGAFDVVLAPPTADSARPLHIDVNDLWKHLSATLHNYMMPERIHALPEPIPTGQSCDVDDKELRRVLNAQRDAALEKLDGSTEGQVAKAFADVLSCHPTEIAFDVDFFSLGGDSLRAGRLLSAVRFRFGVQLPIELVFNNGTVQAISAHLDKTIKIELEAQDDGHDKSVNYENTNSSTRLILMALHLVPLVVVYPLRRAFQLTTFMLSLSHTQRWPTHDSVPGRLFNVLACIVMARLAVQCLAPIASIAAKWAIIGRYREGLYPMWGWYRSRWWMAQKIESICGMGVFDVCEPTRRLYCRLMGARIGRNVKLAGSALGEWDLLDVGDNAVLTRCICRPFAAEGNTTMYLGRISIGDNASIGISSIVAAGSRVPPNTCIGPNSSSWETGDADEMNRHLSPAGAPQPHWLLTCLLILPLGLLAWLLSLLPWACGLVGMVLNEPHRQHTPLRNMLDWFSTAERVAYHYLALALRVLFAPLILFGFTVLAKAVLDALYGKLGPGHAQDLTVVAVWRAHFIKTLMPVSKVHQLTAMFGQHYEATSIVYRLLGSRTSETTLCLALGHISPPDAIGADRITVRDRAMVADRVCLLPGVDIGEEATMVSGALTRRGKAYTSGGTFVSSKDGDAVCLSSGRHLPNDRRRVPPVSRGSDVASSHDRIRISNERFQARAQHMSSEDTLAEAQHPSNVGSKKTAVEALASSDSDSDVEAASRTVSPFGRAFYLGHAPYYVFGPFIFCYSAFSTVFINMYWNVPSVSSIQIVDLLMNRFVKRGNNFWIEISILFALSFVAIAIITTLMAFLSLAVVIMSKWALLGRRQPGNYDWDRSSYCQRWQLFLCIEGLRRQCFCGRGVLGLLTGTNCIVLYFRALGAKIGKDCAIFANGCPSLMFTEPDLITLGDRVVVDDASVVAHINTRGKFDLNKLEIGNRCVLRSGSRLLSGASMRSDSCLLEHTLIMSGDVVEEGQTMQGWPVERFLSQRVFTAKNG